MAWWVIENVFLCSSDKGFWACLGYLPPDMPRRPETWVSLCNLMLKHRGISRSSAILGSDSPQSNKFSTDAGAVLAPLLSGRTRVRHWQSARRLWPDTRGLQLPSDDCCRLVLPFNAVHSIQQTKQIPNEPPRMGAKSTTTSNHPSTPSAGSRYIAACYILITHLLWLRVYISGVFWYRDQFLHGSECKQIHHFKAAAAVTTTTWHNVATPGIAAAAKTTAAVVAAATATTTIDEQCIIRLWSSTICALGHVPQERQWICFSNRDSVPRFVPRNLCTC